MITLPLANAIRVHEAVFKDQVGVSGDGVAIDDQAGSGNMHFVQTTFEGAFSLTFTYHGSDTFPMNCKFESLGLVDHISLTVSQPMS